MKLNDKMRTLRADAGFTQQKVADFLNIDRSTYAYYETGTTKPSIANLQKLSKLYGVSVNDILSGVEGTGTNVASPYEANDLLFSAEEKQIIGIYRSLSDEKKNAFLAFIKAFNN